MRRATVVVALGFLAWVCVLAAPGALAQTNTPRKVTTRIEPIYPGLAREMRLKGVINLEVVVRPNGKVKSTRVLGGNPVFVQPAVDAVQQWRFEASQSETTERVQLNFIP